MKIFLKSVQLWLLLFTCLSVTLLFDTNELLQKLNCIWNEKDFGTLNPFKISKNYVLKLLPSEDYCPQILPLMLS